MIISVKVSRYERVWCVWGWVKVKCGWCLVSRKDSGREWERLVGVRLDGIF